MKYFFLFAFISLFPSFQTSAPSSEAECKGRKTFSIHKKKIKLFSFLFVQAFQASPLPPKRSAKVEKKYTPRNTDHAFYLPSALNSLDNNKKKLKTSGLKGTSQMVHVKGKAEYQENTQTVVEKYMRGENLF